MLSSNEGRGSFDCFDGCFGDWEYVGLAGTSMVYIPCNLACSSESDYAAKIIVCISHAD